MLKSHNRSIISEYTFWFYILYIVKFVIDNHFSDRLLVSLKGYKLFKHKQKDVEILGNNKSTKKY